MRAPLVLSLFPGIGLLDRAFEEEGFCIVRGPDLLWGGDVRAFHPPAGKFDGVIGGPPCQMFSRLARLVRHIGYEPKFGNLIPEFERCVTEAQPRWFLMENVPAAPIPVVVGYIVTWRVVNNRWFEDEDGMGAEQNRTRTISFGHPDGAKPVWEEALVTRPAIATAVTSRDGGGTMRGRRPTAVVGDSRAVPVKLGPGGKVKGTYAVTARHAARVPWVAGSDTAGHGGQNSKQYVYGLEDACELQGLPRDFCEHMPFTKAGKLQVVANGVPLPMGRAIACAVKRALGIDSASEAAQ